MPGFHTASSVGLIPKYNRSSHELSGTAAADAAAAEVDAAGAAAGAAGAGAAAGTAGHIFKLRSS
jgi:hypothetical protein